MISRLFARGPDTRIFFATDIHGSETCWKKFLNSGKHYEAKVIVLGGDMTGKALVPIVEGGKGNWHATLLENRRDFTTEDEVKEFEDSVRRRGYYPFRATPDEMSELEVDEKLRDKYFHEEMLGTVERWMRMAEEKLAGTGIECFVSPGNDDQFEVDE
ncbi:MAG: metallophosphoesterase, partial [Rubrobacteraceae bacterium]|nr:metallophosphoesterase [Rubrobacteraceae bacterium]